VVPSFLKAEGYLGTGKMTTGSRNLPPASRLRTLAKLAVPDHRKESLNEGQQRGHPGLQEVSSAGLTASISTSSMPG